VIYRRSRVSMQDLNLGNSCVPIPTPDYHWNRLIPQLKSSLTMAGAMLFPWHRSLEFSLDPTNYRIIRDREKSALGLYIENKEDMMWMSYCGMHISMVQHACTWSHKSCYEWVDMHREYCNKRNSKCVQSDKSYALFVFVYLYKHMLSDSCSIKQSANWF
jgi:hypothetical protein